MHKRKLTDEEVDRRHAANKAAAAQDKAGAIRERKRLTDYWRALGYDGEFRIMLADFHPRMRSRYWVVCSNMVNGIPTKKWDKDAVSDNVITI